MAAIVVVGVASCSEGAPDASETPVEASSASAEATPSNDAESSAWLETLNANLREAQEQSARERAEAEPTLPMPDGSTWGLAEQFTELTEQIAALESGQDLPNGESSPYKVWYEDGYFTSQMALDWQCAWLSEAVSQFDAGDTGAAQEAVAQLRSFADHPLVSHFPDYATFVATYVDPLGVGDTTAAAPALKTCSPESLVPAYRNQAMP